MKKLLQIQSELKCNKGQYNSFGKYYYRSTESILEALKPLLLKYQCVLKIHDHTFEIAGLPIITSTATIKDLETNEMEAVTAQAGVDIQKKGMDIAQSFGSSSSYARKYALNGLFLIDDTKDSDTPTKKESGPTKPELHPKHKDWDKAIIAISNGTYSLDKLKERFNISKENESILSSHETV